MCCKYFGDLLDKDIKIKGIRSLYTKPQSVKNMWKSF